MAGPPILTTTAKQTHITTNQSDTVKRIDSIKNRTILESVNLKPKNIFVEDLRWKHLVRNVLTSRNSLMLGPSGIGKTQIAIAVAKALGYNYCFIPMGSSQDPRLTLIGSTQFDPSIGTFYAKSRFVDAIQTPNTVVILDELPRAHPEAWNILLPVLDINIRSLSVEENSKLPMVKVDDTVSFIITGNIGKGYSANKKIDAALLDRSTLIEVHQLSIDDDTKLMRNKYPDFDHSMLTTLMGIVKDVRISYNSNKIADTISTRVLESIIEFILDGFTLEEAFTELLYSRFSAESNLESDRTLVIQIVQKYVGTSASAAPKFFANKK